MAPFLISEVAREAPGATEQFETRFRLVNESY